MEEEIMRRPQRLGIVPYAASPKRPPTETFSDEEEEAQRGKRAPVRNDLALFSRKTSKRCLVVLPCQVVCTSICYDCVNVFYILLLSGDVELNPGPPVTRPRTEDDLSAVEKLFKLFEAKLDEKHPELLIEIKSIHLKLEDTDKRLNNLTTKVDSVMNDVSTLPALKADMSTIQDRVKTSESIISNFADSLDDLENRSRRDNLIFHGINDNSNETWSQAESKVISFCHDNLGVSLSDSDIERAHRLGKFQNARNRPIIVKFSSFKTKQTTLSNGFKLKSTKFSVDEDFSLNVRVARKHLLTFAKAQSSTFKLNFNKLYIDGKCYRFDPDCSAVVECKQ
ncbi:uncharacterized protein LOC135386446 [Ornithodoros turicata]|uniref:uncharacterized protein LOC135386446 n=1 Tax=Ornithodoros turicata TaxID=34597 RepID=UPI0031396089